MTIKKRGRPPGAKNRVLILKDKDNRSEISDFAETLKKWDQMETQNNWELIAKKQEDRINVYIAENEELAKICIMRWEEIQHLKYLVTYLEGKHEDSSV